MGRLAGALLSILVCASASGATAGIAFEFVDVTDCKSSEFKTSEVAKGTFIGFFCKSGPKAWTEDEKLEITKAFDHLQDLELGSALIDRVVAERGTIQLLRGTKSVLTPNALADADVHVGAITFYDKRFNASPFEWPLARTTAHEIGHIFDCLPSNVGGTYDCLSGQKPFYKAMKFKRMKFKIAGSSSYAQMQMPKGYVKAEHEAIVAKSKELRDAGQKAEAYAMVKDYAAVLGVPSVYALTDGGEMVADTIAAVVMNDETARNLPVSGVSWVREKILVRQ